MVQIKQRKTAFRGMNSYTPHSQYFQFVRDLLGMLAPVYSKFIKTAILFENSVMKDIGLRY